MNNPLPVNMVKDRTLLIGIKSNNLENLITAYYFTNAVIKHQKAHLKLFFYQDGVYILLPTEINSKWQELILRYHLNAGVCPGSCTKRGLTIKDPFNATSLVQFIDNIDNADRVIQF